MQKLKIDIENFDYKISEGKEVSIKPKNKSDDILIKIAKKKKVENFLTVVDEDFNIDFKNSWFIIFFLGPLVE